MYGWTVEGHLQIMCWWSFLTTWSGILCFVCLNACGWLYTYVGYILMVIPSYVHVCFCPLGAWLFWADLTFFLQLYLGEIGLVWKNLTNGVRLRQPQLWVKQTCVACLKRDRGVVWRGKEPGRYSLTVWRHFGRLQWWCVRHTQGKRFFICGLSPHAVWMYSAPRRAGLSFARVSSDGLNGQGVAPMKRRFAANRTISPSL